MSGFKPKPAGFYINQYKNSIPGILLKYKYPVMPGIFRTGNICML